MHLRKFTVLRASASDMYGMPKILGECHIWDDAVAQVFDVADRKNMVVTEYCAITKSHHTFRFNEDGLVVSVDHFCNDMHCKYDDLESLNR